jgi:hypothetical protein
MARIGGQECNGYAFAPRNPDHREVSMSNQTRMSILRPAQVLSPGDGDPGVSDYSYRFLAQGDSWFSIGAIPPWNTTNLLEHFWFERRACAVNCAYPGTTLSHMVDWVKNSQFVALLTGNRAEKWHGILLSAGGNDLIDASSVLANDRHGNPVPPDKRMLLTQAEWGPGTDVSRYVSAAGWDTLRRHLAFHFTNLIDLRGRGVNRDTPIVVHTYAYITPRNAPASAALKLGPWLYKSFSAYKVPPQDWADLAEHLINRFAEFLLSLQLPSFLVVDTRAVPLHPADSNEHGPSGDWQNEIHPTKKGYEKLGRKWSSIIESEIVGSSIAAPMPVASMPAPNAMILRDAASAGTTPP